MTPMVYSVQIDAHPFLPVRALHFGDIQSSNARVQLYQFYMSRVSV